MIPYDYLLTYRINLGLFHIYSWGLLVAIGFIAGTGLAVREAKKHNIHKDHIYNIVTWLIIGGLLGARILHVISNWQEFSAQPLEILMIWKGGLDFFGGFFIAAFAGAWYVRKHKLKVPLLFDIFAPAMAIGHAFGRIGCMLGDGGHVGKLTTMPWGVLVTTADSPFYGTVRHWTALYEFLALVAIFFVLIWLRKKKHFDGAIFSWYLVMYGAYRFLNDFLRVDSTYLGLTVAQYGALVMLIAGSIVLWKKRS